MTEAIPRVESDPPQQTVPVTMQNLLDLYPTVNPADLTVAVVSYAGKPIVGVREPKPAVLANYHPATPKEGRP